MEKLYRFYKLTDPLDSHSIKYVGQTTRTLQERLRQHIRDRSNSPKSKWIQGLTKHGYIPSIIQIEEQLLIRYDALYREEQWIYHHAIQGHPLTNGDPGSVIIANLLGGSEIDVFGNNWPTIDNKTRIVVRALYEYHEINNMGVKLSQDISNILKHRIRQIREIIDSNIFPPIVNQRIIAALDREIFEQLYERWSYGKQ